MRLAELQPRWWSAHVGEHAGEADRHGLTFLCPHCKTIRLGVAFTHSPKPLDLPDVHGSDPIWTATGDQSFDTLSLSPSVNAESFGHWHGWIRNGEAA